MECGRGGVGGKSHCLYVSTSRGQRLGSAAIAIGGTLLMKPAQLRESWQLVMASELCCAEKKRSLVTYSLWEKFGFVMLWKVPL